MKKKIFTTFYFLTVLFLSSCNGQKENINSLVSIDIELNMKKMVVVNLSNFTDNIEYVSIENVENLPFGYLTDLDVSHDRILLSDMNVCLLYDFNGHFIKKIGNKGRGPGEYPYVTNVNLGQNSKIYLSDTENLYEFNNDGSFVKKYVNSILNERYYLPTWIQINDSLFFGHVPNSTGKIDCKALIVDKTGDIKQSYKNYILFNRKQRVSSTWENHAHIYKFKNEFFYKEIFNDTIFYLTGEYKLIPRYTLNFGKFKEPLSEQAKFPPSDKGRYLFLYNAFQTEKYMFLDCAFGDHFPAKRFTPKPTPIPLPEPIWFNTQNALGIFEKETGKLIFSKPTSTDNPLFTSGLYNDIDAGPRFFPKKQVNDSTLAMWVNAKELKDHVASDDFKRSIPKYPEKKRQLVELAGRLTELDNPVLVFVTFKK